jgi:hypothetical protein
MKTTMDYRHGELRGRYHVEVTGNEIGAIGARDVEKRAFYMLAVDEQEARNKAWNAAHEMGLEWIHIMSCMEVPK